MKNYTSIEQAKKLVEFLPIKSADMGWNVFVDNTTRILPIDDWDLSKNSGGNLKFYPAWSLAALLDVLPSGYVIVKNYHGLYYVESRDHERSTNIFNNSVDACVKMILELHEFKVL